MKLIAGDPVAVAEADETTLATIINERWKVLCFHFDVADQNVDGLKVYARAHPDAQLVDFTPADWTAIPSGDRFRRCARSTTATGALVDGDLDAVTTAQNGYLEMDIDGLAEIVLKASAAADSAEVTPRYSVA